MRPQRAKAAFQEHLRGLGLQLNNEPPSRGIDAVLSFYRDKRADGCAFDDDADMLLFQWGTYDWGDGDSFEFDMTRQLIFDGSEDENTWQLHLVFKFAPTAALRDAGSGDKWCRSTDHVPRFEQFIHSSRPYQLVSHETPRVVELEFECAG